MNQNFNEVQVQPDWRKFYKTKEELESELSGISAEPGLYALKIGTVVVQAVKNGFVAYVWNCTLDFTPFSVKPTLQKLEL